MTDVYAYRFKSELSLEQIFTQFKDLGPWRWIERDNDNWGEYISARTLQDPHYGMAKLIVETDHYVINVLLRSDEPDADHQFDSVRRVLFDRLLPAIGAHELEETDDYE